MGMGRIRSVGQKKCFGDASVWPELLRLRDLNLGSTISDTFATECICRWMREGRDIDAMLPFLSAYMGHARYEDTLYYVHMVPDFYERVGTVDRTAWEKLLPEVHDEG